MGYSRYNEDDHIRYMSSRSYDKKSTSEIYADRLNKELDPKRIAIRESKDSKLNPHSTAIILGLDVTGSMSSVLDIMARNGLRELVKGIYDRKPVEDPHIMCMGIGDVEFDSAPFQVTQFEADIKIAKQLEMLYLEQGGGGNCYESYTLPWYFASKKTDIDCFNKRKKKGYLFTVGDEEITRRLRTTDINKFVGTQEKEKSEFTPQELLKMVSEKYNVFHLMVEEGNHFRSDPAGVTKSWRDILGQNAMLLKDHTKMAQVIISAIQVAEGADIDEVERSWDKETAATVKRAINLRL